MTHVLLPEACLVRRAYRADVIGEVLQAVFAGHQFFEDVARRAGVPPDTVYEWLRRFRRNAVAIARHFGRWLAAFLPGRVLPQRRGSESAYALEMIGAAAKAASLRLGPKPPWSWASALSAGGLLSNTSSPWPLPDSAPPFGPGHSRTKGGAQWKTEQGL
ncbi:MAG: helix-turn-helix domain-containing protein [Candidatus Dormibacterales bacterium]